MWSRPELKCSSSTLPLTCTLIHTHTHTPYTTCTHTHTTHTQTAHETHTNSLQAVWSHICNWLRDHQGGGERVRYAILQKPHLRFIVVHLFKFMSINLRRHHPRLCNLLSSTLSSPPSSPHLICQPTGHVIAPASDRMNIISGVAVYVGVSHALDLVAVTTQNKHRQLSS